MIISTPGPAVILKNLLQLREYLSFGVKRSIKILIIIENQQKNEEWWWLWLLYVDLNNAIELMLLLMVFFGEIENSDCWIDSCLAIVCRNNTNNTYITVISILQNFGTCSPWLSYTSYFFWARALRSSSTKLQNKTTYRRGGLTIIIGGW